MSIKRMWGAGAPAGQWVALDKENARHARVARLRPGEALELIDGAGNFWRGVYEKEGLQVQEAGRAACQKPDIVLAVGLTQGGAMEDIVRQATELGASVICPVRSHHAAPEREAARTAAKHERWQRVVMEACKQSGTYWAPRVELPQTIAQVLERWAHARHVVAALGQGVTPWPALKLAEAPAIVGWVGPEGDWTAQEYEQLKKAGAFSVSLGAHILRVPTACVALLSRIDLWALDAGPTR